MNKLTELMLACHNGACNPYALINDLSQSIKEESDPSGIRQSKEVAYVVAHVAFLLMQGPGPEEDIIRYANEIEKATKQKTEQEQTTEDKID